MPKKPQSKIELLAGVPLFEQCSRKELNRIASLVDEASIEAGRALTREGRVGRECFIVAAGKATVTRGQKMINSLGPGDFFGEMSLLDHQPRSATVTADTDMDLLVLDGRSFATLLDDAPSVAKKILSGLASRLRQAEQAPTH